MKKIFPYLAAIIFVIIGYSVDSYVHKYKDDLAFHYDITGYHNYLPALVIYKDITRYDFLDQVEKNHNPLTWSVHKYGLYEVKKTGNLCNQYPMGVAIFQAPLFFVAHAWTLWSGKFTPDGYTQPYQHATVLTTLIFAFLGLLILTSFLRNYFSDIVTFLTVAVIAFGTNFFQYATLESGMAHIYQFFLYVSVLYLTFQFYKRPNFFHAILMGICIGLAIVTRPIDIFIAIIPLAWSLHLEDRLQFFKFNLKYIGVVILFAFIVCIPQLIYWKYVTGDWIYYSYSDVDYFTFERFRLIHGLFSYRKGWFIYTPIALVAFIRMLLIKRESRFFAYKKLFFIFFIPMIYLIFSWNSWMYGWSFGCRALIGTLPLLGIPIALLFEEFRQYARYKKYLFVIVVTFIVFLNLFQTWQYNKQIIHGYLMNEILYWEVFLKTERPGNMDELIRLQNEMDWHAGGW